MLNSVKEFFKTQPKDASSHKGTWAIASTIRAPQFMVDEFIQHHLQLGCDQIYIFFDDPDYAFVDKDIEKNEKVKVYVCDDFFWGKQKIEYPRKSALRPGYIEGRQYANYQKVQRETSCEWLLHIDVDEFLNPFGSVKEILAKVPSNIFLLGIKPYEAIYDFLPSDEEIFKTPYFKSLIWPSPEIITKVFDESLLPQKFGFWGHNLGKGFFRVKDKIKSLSCHFPKPLNRNYIPRFFSDKIELLHFESMDQSKFVEKRMRRISKDTYAKNVADITVRRYAYAEALLDQYGVKGLEDLYVRMNVLDAASIKLLEDNDLLVRRRLGENKNEYNEKVVIDHHGGTLFVPKKGGVVVSGEINRNVTPVFLEMEPGNSNQLYMFAMVSGERQYIFMDDRGYLVTCPGKECQIFSHKKTKEGVLSLYFNKVYMTSKPDGKVVFSASECKAWEKFSISKHIV